jgi:hypothetical protein
MGSHLKRAGTKLAFRFSLRTLLGMVTVVLLWIGYYVNWKHERREALELPHTPWRRSPSADVKLPIGLRITGEQPREGIDLPPGASDELLARFQSLFPEAEVRRSQWSPDQMDSPAIR